MMSDKYIELGFEIHSQEVFGWGERNTNYLLNPGEYTTYPTGIKKEKDPAKKGYNTYGDHPFVLARNNDHSFIGIFFKNSNAKVLKYIKESNGRSVINFRSIGGIIDVFAFMGDTAEEVLQRYQAVIGKPYLPPLYALGWQLGSASYKNDSAASTAADNYVKNGIPFDLVWLDEQYMKNYHIFEVDTTKFKNIKSLANWLHTDNRWLGLSVHPGIAVYNEDGKFNSFYEAAKKADALVKTSHNTTKYDDVLIGEGLPGKVAYLDFMDFQGHNSW